MYTIEAAEGIRYLVSAASGGDGVGHEVVGRVGEDGCLYVEVNRGVWLGAIGDSALEVSADGISVHGETTPFGQPFRASRAEVRPIGEVPQEYRSACAGADDVWGIAP